MGTPLIEAQDDVTAVQHWLAEYRASPQTLRQYRKEAERLLLWLREQGLTLGDMNRQRVDIYDEFLANPQPSERWVGPSKPRHSPLWRPFRSPLSASSRRQTLIILQGMFAWLVEAGWLKHNPFRLMRDKRRRLDNRHESIERYLERPLWKWLWQQRLDISLISEATPRQHYCQARLRFIFGFAYLLGPRISEMSAARMNDFIKREGQWWWRVIGKGGKRAQVPLTPDMQTLLREWRATLGLEGLPHEDEATPVIRALNGVSGLSDNQLYRLIKTEFSEAADALETTSDMPELTRQLRHASPHWLRHTAITHQAQSGVELRYLAKTARHSRLDTTARYLHAEAQEWQQQLTRHTLMSQDTDEEGESSL
ncbi:tyrosine-type recombinase/integrase [Phytohalomonas tamaricis]|uniref:tyrosine-type recombinase/integrase n=1 Tax=Phytohalomonas tamaricis TaxID=2081032 RepID=UPI0021D4143E|nr:site-specific integrase [Phytohalomonas tamaricis]